MRISTFKANSFLLIVFALVSFTFQSTSLFAQNKKPKMPKTIVHQKWELGGFIGASQYQGDLQKADLKELNLANGLFVRYHINDNIALRGGFSYGKLTGDDRNYTDEVGRLARGFNFKSPARELALLVEYDILGKKRYTNLDKGKFNKIISPYLFAGAGFVNISPEVEFSKATTNANKLDIASDEAKKTKKGNFTMPLGLGFKMDISKFWTVGLEAGLRLTFSDYIDGVSLSADPKKKDTYAMGGLVLSYRIPFVKDTDGDGIGDEVDACPEIAGPLKSKGCPDKDGDGTGDQFDKCPDTPGLKSALGCPDADRDGVSDSEDICPDMIGLKDLKGCPDADEDGVADKDDECPSEKGSADYNGCPTRDSDNDGIEDKLDECPKQKGSKADNGCPAKDSDGDGVADRDDLCPDEKGLARFNGCADSDSDGISDKDDKCPDIPGTNLNQGCPEQEIKKEDKEILKTAIYGVEFETGSAKVKTQSFDILDNVFTVLQKYPEYTMNISGHTDKMGKELINVKLSQARAKACYDYFVSKGINADRMKYEGIGSALPVADNKTAVGRAKNRRVEFSLFVR
jgi:outer membrane protein OmpA-like peptidoglycan-associated protein/opacity protein-like surface antigen